MQLTSFVSTLAVSLFVTLASIGSLGNKHAFANSLTLHHHQYPWLFHMVPKSARAEHSLNDASALSNKLLGGWVLAAAQPVELLLYVLTDDAAESVDDIEHACVYFTTSEDTCDDHSSQQQHVLLNASAYAKSDIYHLRFIKERSHFHSNKQSQQTNASLVATALAKGTTLLVAEINASLPYSPDKYYTCLYLVGKKTTTTTTTATTMNDTNMRFVHQGTSNVCTQIQTREELMPLALVILIYFCLLCFSALFSGLNLGLMSLDLNELNLLKKIGSKREKTYANKIYPLRRRGNQLLCTILLGNVLVNSTSTLILGSYIEGIFAAVGSTLLIVLFGEIIPQAICSRYGLAVGAYTRYVTYVVMGLTSPLSYPLSKLLTLFLGKEISATFTRDKVRELMRQAKEGKDIEEKQYKLISGALDFKHKSVKETMVPVKDVFSLDINSHLDFDTFKKILYHGYSRIPVYEHATDNLIGMILFQDLLLNDPADRVPLRAVMDYYKHPVPKCKLSDSLDVMFDKFRKGDSHLAFVYDDAADLSNDEGVVHQEAVGILTLENIIEELVQSEIMDEADNKRAKRRRKAREFLNGKLANTGLSNENLNIFVTEVDQTSQPLISPQIRKALFYFLASSVRPFMAEFIVPKLLEVFLRQPELTREKRNLSGNDRDVNMYLYQYGVPCDYFVIILDGSALVQVGKEGLEVQAGLFSYYGVSALLNESERGDPHEIIASASTTPYVPEFSLQVVDYCVYLKITRGDWLDAVKKSIIERTYALPVVPLQAPLAPMPSQASVISTYQPQQQQQQQQQRITPKSSYNNKWYRSSPMLDINNNNASTKNKDEAGRAAIGEDEASQKSEMKTH